MLTGVTITGADDWVDPDDLLQLSYEFPFVEWGSLMSSKRAGTPRYPHESTMYSFLRAVERSSARCAVHLCGANARAFLEGREGDELVWLGAFHRVQVNGWAPGFAEHRMGLLASAKRIPHTKVILQVRHESHLLAAVIDAQAIGNGASVLFDLSGGTGQRIELFPAAAGCSIGYAGGIGPDNVVEVLEAITRSPMGRVHDFWIDMESGVRTNDVFDLGKAWEVLERAKPFVQREMRTVSARGERT